MNPKVSIIIPVYNGSNFLKQAIDSALAQTYKNIEIIVVNDGSGDNGATEKIAKSYGDKIRYFKKENGGVATALNLGIKKMTGEYFSWLSHDDLYFTDKIEKQIKYLDELDDKKVILYSNYQLINEYDEFIAQCIFDHEMLGRIPIYSLLRGNVNGTTLLIPKSAFIEYGEFDALLRCTQDYDMWYRMIKTYKFIHMEDVLSKTRLHSNQDTVANPRTVEECNRLWIRMVDNLPDKQKIGIEGDLYNFYQEMVKFLKTTHYEGAIRHCQEKSDQLIEEAVEKYKKYKVSVVIPFYNGIRMLEDSIESVLSQTHKNIEIILVDDASTDDCKYLINKYSDNKTIRFLKLDKNKGAAAARNYGIDNCKGDYVAFLDSDDIFLSNKLIRQVTHMISNHSTMSHTSYVKRTENGDENINTSSLSGDALPGIISNCKIATPTVMLKRSAIGDTRFIEDFRIGEDVCFWLELARKNKLLAINEYLTVVNVTKTNTISDDSKVLIGIKNILSFVLRDDEYKKYDGEVYVLCSELSRIYEKINGIKNKETVIEITECANCELLYNSSSWKITKPIRLTKNFMSYFRNNGFIIPVKKLAKKIIRKISKLK